MEAPIPEVEIVLEESKNADYTPATIQLKKGRPRKNDYSDIPNFDNLSIQDKKPFYQQAYNKKKPKLNVPKIPKIVQELEIPKESVTNKKRFLNG